MNIGSEKWFAEIVGLPNWGINPLRDLFHVKNTDLFDVFQRKVSHKGYELAQCKSLKVKSRMEELWGPIFQCSLPNKGYMPKSFARAVVSEVLHSTTIDWAKLASAKWRAKPIPAKIYYYTEGGHELTYKKIFLERLNAKADGIDEQLGHLEEERERLRNQLKVLQSSPEETEKAEMQKKVDSQVKNLNAQLRSTKFSLKTNRKMASFMATDPSCTEECEEWTQCIARDVAEIEALRKQIKDLKENTLHGNSDLISVKAALNNVKKKIMDAKGRAAAVRDLFEVYGKKTRRPQSLTPSCIVGELADPNDSKEFVQKCALCNAGFPSRDVVMASCGCYYHPWCIVTQTWHSKFCFDESCTREFTDVWRRSMGLFYFEGTFSQAQHQTEFSFY